MPSPQCAPRASSRGSSEERAERGRAYIPDILRRHWDPIGIKHNPAVQDEYDAYVAGVYRLIAAGATTRQIAEHLVQVETDRLGFVDTDPKMLIPVAEKLLKLNVQLPPNEPAA